MGFDFRQIYAHLGDKIGYGFWLHIHKVPSSAGLHSFTVYNKLKMSECFLRCEWTWLLWEERNDCEWTVFWCCSPVQTDLGVGLIELKKSYFWVSMERIGMWMSILEKPGDYEATFISAGWAAVEGSRITLDGVVEDGKPSDYGGYWQWWKARDVVIRKRSVGLVKLPGFISLKRAGLDLPELWKVASYQLAP